LREKNQDTDKKAKIISKYNLSSHFYDQRYKEIQNQKYRIILDEKYLRGNFFLDVGCGTGLLLEFLLNMEMMPEFRYVGIDISIEMLNQFKNKLKSKLKVIEKNNQKRISLLVADLQNTSSIPIGFKELLRIGKGNSILISSFLKKSNNLEIFLTQIKENLKHYELIDNNSMEDILIRGTVKKT
jgi:ubiquinone/menaquinone biosynthesis C-methylase UbiE